MGERGGKPPISVEIGLKAGLEVKGEIPKKSLGRLVDSLTDLIRPFTEARGLRADQIRLQREDILIRIARKALARAQLEGIKLNPVPMKMLVPFMEKASTEDMDSEMHDRWAALLLSASSQFHARHLTFLDILGRLSSDELKFLENVCFSFKDFPETSYPSGHIEQNRASVEAAMEHLFVPNGIGSQHAYLKFVNETKLTYGEIMHASVVVAEGGHAFHYSDFGAPGLPGFGSLEILQRERLIEIERLKSQKIDVEAAYFNLTFLGITFVRDCSPEGSRMWQERLGRAGVG